jgi:hypothetical protein
MNLCVRIPRVEIEVLEEAEAISLAYWEYRLFRECFGDTVEITIREVYFDEAGKPLTATERGVGPMGETTDELRDDLALMMTAFNLPIMSDADFSKVENIKPENT